MRAFRVVDDQIIIQVLLHLFQGFVPLGALLNAEVLVQQRVVQPLDEPVALRPSNLGGTVFDLFELKKKFIRMSTSVKVVRISSLQIVRFSSV